jgi:hypothetical protein
LLAPGNEAPITTWRVFLVEFLVQVGVWLPPIRTEGIKIKLNQVGDPLGGFFPNAIHDLCKEGVEYWGIHPERGHVRFPRCQLV